MSLKEELQNRTPRSTSGTYSKGKCGVIEWLKNKDDDFIKETFELIDDKAISTNLMYNFFHKTYPEITFGLTTFKRHRNRECSCP
jgi:hypothetical protein